MVFYLDRLTKIFAIANSFPDMSGLAQAMTKSICLEKCLKVNGVKTWGLRKKPLVGKNLGLHIVLDGI